MSLFNLKTLDKKQFAALFFIWIIFEITPHANVIGHLIGLVLTIAVIGLGANILKTRLAQHNAKA